MYPYPKSGYIVHFLCVCACMYGCFAGPRKLEAMFRTALNEDQRAAVRKLVTAKDYALLLGMPGTGELSDIDTIKY